jgi:ribosomal protein S18 acetylase RimI-like enzyme
VGRRALGLEEMNVTFKQASCQLDFLESPKGKYAVINEVYVPPAHRHQGLATSLLQKAIGIAHEEGCYKVLCWSRFSNEIAHRLYEKVGLKKWGYEFRLDLNTEKPSSPGRKQV